jgi:hypothetical protein
MESLEWTSPTCANNVYENLSSFKGGRLKAILY